MSTPKLTFTADMSPPRSTRTTAHMQRARKGTDQRQVPDSVIGDPTFVPRLCWSALNREPRDSELLIRAMRESDRDAFFVDSSFFDDTTPASELSELLRVPGRVHITVPVRTELDRYLETRDSHPLARAFQAGDPAIVAHPIPGPLEPGRLALEFYVALLIRRRVVADDVRLELAQQRDGQPEDQDDREVFALVQQRYGDRGRLLAEKGFNPLATDEILVYQAVEHAIQTGQRTVILTKDADLEEQFYKLTWTLTSHYKAMLAAKAYVRDFGTFETITIPRPQEDDTWQFEGDAVLIDARRWGENGDRLLPAVYRSGAVSCWNMGPVTSQMAFAVDREMADLLDVKDRTRGRSTDQLGDRNLHFHVPPKMLAGRDPDSYVVIGRDRTVRKFETRANIPMLDVGYVLASSERPRAVVMHPRSKVSSIATPQPQAELVSRMVVTPGLGPSPTRRRRPN